MTGPSSPAPVAAGLQPADAASAGLHQKPAATGCGLRAFGVVRAGPEAIAALRQKPGPPGTVPGHFRPNLLKHADEQTVTGLAAVLTAIHRFRLGSVDFSSWGAVAAPRWIGRLRAAAALNRFHREGLPGASPMIVPHLSLHAASGTISQTLHIHGPNFGIGSGPGHVAEGLLAALALVAEDRLPGLWLVLSQWHPEPAPDALGQVPAGCVCHAAALALVPVAATVAGPRLRLLPPVPVPQGTEKPPGVRSLTDFLDGSPPAGSWLCPLDWGGWVELTGVPEQPEETLP